MQWGEYARHRNQIVSKVRGCLEIWNRYKQLWFTVCEILEKNFGQLPIIWMTFGHVTYVSNFEMQLHKVHFSAKYMQLWKKFMIQRPTELRMKINKTIKNMWKCEILALLCENLTYQQVLLLQSGIRESSRFLWNPLKCVSMYCFIMASILIVYCSFSLIISFTYQSAILVIPNIVC